MSDRLKKNFEKLRLINESSPKMRKRILSNCKPDLLCCLCECAMNVLKGNVPLKKSQKSKLSRFRHMLRKLALKKTGVKIKKRIVQTGGFLGALLTPVLSFLGTLLSGALVPQR